MNKVIFIFTALCFSINGLSQAYLTRYENYLEPTLINPAVTGADYIPKLTMMYNRQWLDVSQSPYSFFVSGQMRLGKFDFYNPRKFINDTRFKSLERVGLGAGLYSDVQGPFYEINLLLTYSYHIPVNDNTNLSFGITGKVNYYGVNNAGLQPRQSGDPNVNFESSLDANTNIGIYLYQREYFTGISMVNIFPTDKNREFYVEQPASLYFMAAYKLKNENKSVIIEPLLITGYELKNSKLLLNYHIKLYYKQYGWMSISYTNTGQFGAILAFRLKDQLYLAYKYCGPPRNPEVYGYGSHGIVLGKNFGIDKYLIPDY